MTVVIYCTEPSAICIRRKRYAPPCNPHLILIPSCCHYIVRGTMITIVLPVISFHWLALIRQGSRIFYDWLAYLHANFYSHFSKFSGKKNTGSIWDSIPSNHYYIFCNQRRPRFQLKRNRLLYCNLKLSRNPRTRYRCTWPVFCRHPISNNLDYTLDSRCNHGRTVNPALGQYSTYSRAPGWLRAIWPDTSRLGLAREPAQSQWPN